MPGFAIAAAVTSSMPSGQGDCMQGRHHSLLGHAAIGRARQYENRTRAPSSRRPTPSTPAMKETGRLSW